MKVAGVGRRIVLSALIGSVPAIWALALAAPAGALPSGCSQVQRTVTCTFGSTGSEQTFSVPAGIGSVQIDAVGASGGGSAGGLGGSASATVPVTSGETLYVEVGAVGDAAPNYTGGFNGGGRADGNAGALGGAGGGGGASDVRTVSSSGGSSLTSRLVVAAGGGGSGAFGNGLGSIGRGGAADSAGTNGAANGTNGGGGGGGAGSSSTGGTAGAAGAAPGGNPGGAGHIGTPGVGGDGTGGNFNATGGGGGGYFGGGGGGGGGESSGPTAQAGGGGGGGGSCFALGTVACGANSSTTPSVTITYTLPDTTAPTISISSPGANAVYSLGAGVPASYSCADEGGGSGLATCQGTVASGSAIDTSTAGAHTFTVSAVDNAGNSATQTVDYTVVGTPPTPSAPSVSILSPIAGHRYKAGQRVPARYTCTEGASGPGIKSCTGTVRSGGLINTQSLGHLKFTVTAVSNDGQSSSKTVTYSVRAPRVVSSASYVVSIEGQQTSWVFTHLVALHQPQQSCTLSGPLRLCGNGKGKSASFTLRAPLTDDTSLLSWKNMAKNSPDARKTIVLEEIIPTSSLKSKTGTTTVRWRLTGAWPSKITIAGSRTIATVTVTFTGTALKRLTP